MRGASCKLQRSRINSGNNCRSEAEGKSIDIVSESMNCEFSEHLTCQVSEFGVAAGFRTRTFPSKRHLTRHPRSDSGL